MMISLLLEDWENGLELAKETTEEFNDLFNGKEIKETLFCLLAYVCYTLNLLSDDDVKEIMLAASHVFIDLAMKYDMDANKLAEDLKAEGVEL